MFDESCVKAFEKLWSLLVSAPIAQPPNFSLLFEIMCDVFVSAIGTVLGQMVSIMPQVICYASRTLIDARMNYCTA